MGLLVTFLLGGCGGLPFRGYRVYGASGHGDLVSGLQIGITRVTIWVIGVSNLLNEGSGVIA